MVDLKDWLPTSAPTFDDPEYIRIRRRRTHHGRPVGAFLQDHPLVIDMRHLAWQADAACRGTDTEAFFEEPANDYIRALCQSCPVMQECRADARKNKLVGWWGGEGDSERLAVRNAEALQAQASPE